MYAVRGGSVEPSRFYLGFFILRRGQKESRTCPAGGWVLGEAAVAGGFREEAADIRWHGGAECEPRIRRNAEPGAQNSHG